jgi:hypothetical protein
MVFALADGVGAQCNQQRDEQGLPIPIYQGWEEKRYAFAAASASDVRHVRLVVAHHSVYDVLLQALKLPVQVADAVM